MFKSAKESFHQMGSRVILLFQFGSYWKADSIDRLATTPDILPQHITLNKILAAKGGVIRAFENLYLDN